MPALIKVCGKGVAKAGRSSFKFKGKDYDVKVNEPLTRKVDRPASKSPKKAPGKSQMCKTRKLATRAPFNASGHTRLRPSLHLVERFTLESAVLIKHRKLATTTAPSLLENLISEVSPARLKETVNLSEFK